jgi:GNAT superfamily N-acetyltransferase
MIREIMQDELEPLLALYVQLHPGGDIGSHESILAAWERISSDRSHHIIVAETGGRIVASCVVVIVPNLTHGAHPYALVENVITDAAYRRQGWATRCLDYAKQIALRAGCYKMMLLTGTKEESTLCFYEQAGYNRQDKTAFIQWLD